MATIPASRSATEAIPHRTRMRRHLPSACIVSIVIALRHAPSIEMERVAPPRGNVPVPAATFEITARLFLAHDGCGVLTARIAR